MSKASMIGPNPLSAAHMSAEERLKELATILAAGVIRARLRAAQKARDPEADLESEATTGQLGRIISSAASPPVRLGLDL
jgi:hypothetical protein